ncbi:MAG TPA: hypothetical protein VLH19_00525 [Patescibacteria group bacterium]|nr:hypothetical protein [Patescibacteria group bacterium]
MVTKTFTSDRTNLEYFISGTHPRLLIGSGIHGNEYESIPFITAYLEKHEEKLPDFIYIPSLSPTAAAHKTRQNSEGLDVNRSFIGEGRCEESRAIIKFLSDFSFDQFLSFHEDPDNSAFYLYDAHGGLTAEVWNNLHTELTVQKIPLFTGIDDSDDLALGYRVKNGYCKWSFSKPSDHSIETWSVQSGIADSAVVIEVPGLISKADKKKTVEAVLSSLIKKEKEEVTDNEVNYAHDPDLAWR